MDFIAKAKAAFGKVHLCILLLHLYPFCPFDAFIKHIFALHPLFKERKCKKFDRSFPRLILDAFRYVGRAIFAIPENWQINCVFPQRVQKRSSL